ncbi:DUF2510 domain-containing protein [Demequina phytophila]|uniref:DUF2510 domain-containing protein n=1 Tax=Demequina phytophila TaxID=1638981 RepID=UPI000780D954|nr:DUF2510 domain-containing protein [Demequina phytophila]
MTDQQPTSATDFAAPAAVAPAPELPPAGWYPDPEQAGQQRYWDGREWGTHRVIDPAVRDQRSSTAPRARVGAIVGWSIAGAVVLLGLIGGAIAMIVPELADAASEAGGRELTAAPGDGWSTQDVLEGGGTIAVDPAWEDVTDIIGVSEMEDQMAGPLDVDVHVDGAWLTAGDVETGGVMLMVISAVDTGGPSVARVETTAFISSATAGFEDVTTTAQGAVRTSSGLTAYLAEYEHPYYDLISTNAVGVVVDGERQVLVYSTGSDTLGSGVENVETVLNSLTID